MAPAPMGGIIMGCIGIMGGGAPTGGGGGWFVSPIGSATPREHPLLRPDCCKKRDRNRIINLKAAAFSSKLPSINYSDLSDVVTAI